MRDTVLIDGDILIFQVASSAEVATEFEEDLWVLWADAKEARNAVDNAIEAILTMTGCDNYIFCLTGANNFRYKVSDTYKSNRTGKRKPMLLKHLREYTKDKHDARCLDTLEGDDIIGILATGGDKDKMVIYSADKDLKTIEGVHYDGGLMTEITLDEANKFFYTQVLTGDTTDGYKGCPQVGAVGAAKLLADCTTELELWAAVVAAYEKKGLTAEDAIVQARQAYILKAKNLNQHGSVVMWQPPEKETS